MGNGQNLLRHNPPFLQNPLRQNPLDRCKTDNPAGYNPLILPGHNPPGFMKCCTGMARG